MLSESPFPWYLVIMARAWSTRSLAYSQRGDSGSQKTDKTRIPEKSNWSHNGTSQLCSPLRPRAPRTAPLERIDPVNLGRRQQT